MEDLNETNEDYYDVEESVETPKKKRGCAKYLFWLMLLTFLLVAGYTYVNFYFVFGEGVKAGQLNYVVYKGYLFKTYEGKMIQSGFRSSKVNSAGIQSNEFVFSVEKKAVAQQLMKSGGAEVQLHYKEYKKALPWRGVSKFVVDSILTIKKNPEKVPAVDEENEDIFSY